MSDKSYLTRDAILAATDLAFEDVAVPEWGGTVRVRGMTGAERDTWESALLEDREQAVGKKIAERNIRATLVSLTVVDKDGQRLFTEADVAALGRKSVRALQRVYDVAQRLSRITKDDLKELSGN